MLLLFLLLVMLSPCTQSDAPHWEDYYQVFGGTLAEEPGFIDKNNPSELAIVKLCEEYKKARQSLLRRVPQSADEIKEFGQTGMLGQDSFTTRLTKLTSPASERKVAVGLFLMEGQLGLTKATVKKHIGLLEKDHPAQEVLKKGYSQFDDDLTSALERYLKSDDKPRRHVKVLQLIDEQIKIADKAMEQALLPVLTRDQRDRYLSLLREAQDAKIAIPKRKWRERASFISTSVQRQLGLNLNKPPLQRPPSLLRLATTKKVQEFALFTPNDIAIVDNLRQTYLAEYDEIQGLYQMEPAEKSGTAQLLRSNVHYTYYKMLVSTAESLDNQLKQRLPEKPYARLTQIKLQTATASVGFSRISSDESHFKILRQMKPSKEQEEKYRTMKEKYENKLNESLFSRTVTASELNQMRAEDHVKLGHQVYQTIMTDEQRKLWDKLVGEKLSDKEIIVIRMEMLNIKK